MRMIDVATLTRETTRELVAGNPETFIREPFCGLYCQGCGYNIFQRLLLEVMEEMNLIDDAICVIGCGCAGVFTQGMNIDALHVGHGHPPDAATAIKRTQPDRFVMTVQGDGDALAIGTEALIHAGARGEKITIIMLNNGTYGNTGGQMAPTSLIGQVTTTSPGGRDPSTHGFPIHAAELMAQFEGVVFSARCSTSSPAHYIRTKKTLRKAFQKQIEGSGLAFVEVLTACPTNWHMTPRESMKRIEQEQIPLFPVGVVKDVTRN